MAPNRPRTAVWAAVGKKKSLEQHLEYKRDLRHVHNRYTMFTEIISAAGALVRDKKLNRQDLRTDKARSAFCARITCGQRDEP